jgi:hypothetical protein
VRWATTRLAKAHTSLALSGFRLTGIVGACVAN